MKVDIITFSMGRYKYLMECIKSVAHSMEYDEDFIITHHVVFQGVNPPDEFYKEVRRYGRNVNYHYFKENIGIGAGLNRILDQINGDLIIKVDEDAKFLTYGALEELIKIHQAYPDRVFSPFVIGLQNNLGGVPGYTHEHYYDEEEDSYYMLRMVNHIGGIARCVPKKIYDRFRFLDDLDHSGVTSGNEDGQFSTWCKQQGIKMMYMDTHAVVEHQEGTLCQKMRYPEYFEKRR